MNIAYNGYNENLLTMPCDSALEQGMAVTVKEDGKAYPCMEGDVFCGFAASVRGNYAGVQFSGFVRMKADGEIPAGMKKLTVGAEGRITEGAEGRECIVLENYEDQTVGFIF